MKGSESSKTVMASLHTESGRSQNAKSKARVDERTRRGRARESWLEEIMSDIR